MHHYAPKAVEGTLLFRDHLEARALWQRLVSALPDLAALTLMPNHVHLLHPAPVLPQLRQAMSAYARWRNHRRGRHGAVWARCADGTFAAGLQKQRRDMRYIHLNPCRAKLCDDPLAWPWSTHRDAVGLAWPPARPPVRRQAAFHAYVSGDPSVSPQGTPLPAPAAIHGRAPLSAILDTLSALTRTPLCLFSQRGPARSAFLRVARASSDASTSEIAAFLGVSPRAVRAVPRAPDPLTHLVARTMNDPRFSPLDEVLEMR